MAAATKLRHIIENPQSFLLCPGVYDGLSARVALSVGFDGLYMTGAGSAASVLGHAELGLMTQTHMRANAEMIAELGSLPEQTGGPIPLIADGDTGYGGPIMVARTVQQYARSGVAGLHIEDQVQMKRCGHLAGKEVVEQDIYFSRIRAAVNARKQINSDIIIIARTDALQTHGYDEAIRRLKGACQAGADVAFLEGLTSKAQASRLIKDLFPVPVLLNILEAGSTPSFSADEAREIGFKIMISPFLSIIPAYEAMKTTLQHFKDTGSMNDESKKVTPQDLFRICGLDSTIKIDRESGGRSFLNGVD